jgi:hypothetical protein
MRQSIVTRDGRRNIEVVTLKRRISRPQGQKARKAEAPISLSDVLERLARIHSNATKLRTVDDKSDLIRALGSLEADLRRKGVE